MDNIKTDTGKIGWGGLKWICLAQDKDKWRPFVNAIMSLWVAQNAGKLSSGLSSSVQLHRVSYLVNFASIDGRSLLPPSGLFL
jgi:hypothetical protein